MSRFTLVMTFVFICAVALSPTNGVAYSISGDYDEQVSQTNTVDFTASGSNLSAERFEARVEEAYLHNAGGVLDGSILGAYAEFGVDESKTLYFHTGDLGVGNTGSTATAISGTSSFAITDISRSGHFGFNGITQGASPGEQVVEVGFTALSSSNTTYPDVTIAAVLDNGSRITAQRAIYESAGSGDTFFGFTAPAGRYINSIDVDFSTSNSVVRLWMDDIGFRTAPVAQQRLEMTATVDGQASSTNGVDYTITESNYMVYTQTSPGSNIYKRGVIEFSMDQIPSQIEVANAMLELDICLFTQSSNDPCEFDVIGYAGNGSLDASDATQIGSVIGQGIVNDLGILAISLDTTFVESVINSGSDLGLLMMPDATGNQAGWFSSGYYFADFKPTLTLDYTAVPEPGTLVMLAAIAALAIVGWKRATIYVK